MAIKSKWTIISLFWVFVLFGVAYFYSEKYEGKFFMEWMDAYNGGRDTDARNIAKKMARIGRWDNAFYLGHMAITDFIHFEAPANKIELSEALNRMEWVKFTFHTGVDWRPFIELKASISTLLGDKQQAAQYATEACNLKIRRTFEECIIGKYGFDNPAEEPFGNRFSAILLYEHTILYNAVGTGDKTQSTFYQAVALKYFDLNQAHALLNKLTREGRLTPEMQKIYCNPASPPDDTICKTPQEQLKAPTPSI